MYKRGDFDLAGFVLESLRKDELNRRLIQIKAGDTPIALASSGIPQMFLAW